MLKGTLVIVAAGIAFIAVSTLTRVDYTWWQVMNSAFGLLVTGTAFVCAADGARPSWRRGFAAGALGSAVFCAVLLAWVYGAQAWLVQLPFEHFSFERSGAASVSEFLVGAGSEFWTLAIFAWALMLIVVALSAAGGVMFGRLRGRVRDGVAA